jgi:hypothetical protein
VERAASVHATGASKRRATPIARGSRPSTAALTRLGAVALRRLSHSGRDGRNTGVLVADDQISEVTRRLSELLTIVEHRPLAAVAVARSTESVVPAASMSDDDTGMAMITLRFDTQMLARVDAASKRLGISRTAWLHFAADELLKGQ